MQSAPPPSVSPSAEIGEDDAKSAAIEEADVFAPPQNIGGNLPKWYTAALRTHGRQKADEVRQVLNVIYVMAPFPLFWCLFDQQSSTWTIQAEQLNGKLGKTQILPDQMQMFNALLILVFLPLFDRVVYPTLRRCGLATAPLTRMLAGMFLASLAFVTAGLLQLRIDSCPNDEKCVHMLSQVGDELCGRECQFVPAVLVVSRLDEAAKAAYAFLSIPLIVCIWAAPRSMKALMQSVWLLSVCFGNVLVIALEGIFSALNISMAASFFLNSCLMLVAMAWFYALSKSYHFVHDDDDGAAAPPNTAVGRRIVDGDHRDSGVVAVGGHGGDNKNAND
eukprot:jgi/Bigna1/81194/fgenesh1_pg.78_\